MHSSRQDRLNSIEHVVWNQWIEVSMFSDDTVARRLHDADVQLILQHRAERLSADWQALSRLQPSAGHFVQQLLFRKSSGGEVSEDLLNHRGSLGIGYEAFSVRPWNVDVADGGQERPSSQFKGGLHHDSSRLASTSQPLYCIADISRPRPRFNGHVCGGRNVAGSNLQFGLEVERLARVLDAVR